ncbi:MAG: anaerobic glycerol-3-phosphate dehydrogenase subunit GlpC [Bacteroidales bacterium]|nr:anaerobic glycerol-3-phosphate dehydrogenase subunit GlpC [Bacteroidales bacterium]MDD6722828.1 anaerobic glycerol-3-phosphate dehydrogenase subunit GlpC [Bacteroidales bacterium]
MEYQIKNISPNNLEQCIKCTICTVYCPVAAVKPEYPGPKQAGPDGERYRLKNPDFFDKALKYCLNCKRCEVSCPNNVRIGDIIQMARINYEKGAPKLRDRMLAETDFMGTMASAFAPVVNLTLGLKPVKFVLDKTMGIDGHRTFPTYSGKKFVSWFKKNAAAEQDKLPRRIAYFHGCYVNYNYPQLGIDFVHIMNACGIGVTLMEKEKCCGVAKVANRLIDRARKDATTNVAEMKEALARGAEAIVGCSSSCIFTMRDEYPHLLGVDNNAVRDDIFTATAYLYHLIEKGEIKLAFRKDFSMNAAYHTPCHMQKLGWGVYSAGLMRMIPGLKLTTLEQTCCGMAGTYGFKKENYPTSQAIGSELFGLIDESGADVVITDCETCKWQIEMSTGRTVLNPITVLAQALDFEETARLNGVKK